MGESAPYWLRYLQEHDLLKETLLIPLIEAAIYWVLLKPLKTWQALAISYSANLVSWGIGLFVPGAWIYHLMLPEG